MFKYSYVFRTLLQNYCRLTGRNCTSQPVDRRVILSTNPVFGEKKKKTVTRTNLLKCSGWFLVWWRFIRYWLIITYCKWSDWNSKGGVNSVFQASKPRIKICIHPRRVGGYYCLCKDRVWRDISYYYFSLAWINAENIIFDTPSLLFNYYLSNFWIVVIAGWRSQFSHLFVYHCITV